MGLLKSLFGKKTTQDTKTTGTSTVDTSTERTAPDWLTEITKGFADDIGTLGETSPQDRFAGADPLQTKAYTDAMGLGNWGGGPIAGGGTPGGTGGGGFDPAMGASDTFSTDAFPGKKTGVAGTSPVEAAAAQFAGGAAPAPNANPFLDSLGITRSAVGAAPATYDPTMGKAASVLDNYDAIMAKFGGGRVDSALADFDKGAGDSRAQLMLDEAGSGAFQNSGSALERAALAGELSRGRATTADNIRTDAERFAAGLATGDADRLQSASFNNASIANAAKQYTAGATERGTDRNLAAGAQLADIASQYGGEKRADIGTEATLGQVFRDISTGEKNVDIDTLSKLEELLGGLPLEMFGGQKTTGTTATTGTSKTKRVDQGSLADNIGQAIQIAAAAAALSDRRLKTDVARIGTRPDGLGIYAFRSLWDDVRRVGVMAQEVLKVKPEAVIHLPSGFLAVDYGSL